MFPSPNIFHQTPALSPTHSELGWEPQWIVVALSLFSVAASVWLRPSGAPAPLRFVWDSRPLRLVGRRGAPVASHLPPGPTLQSPRPCLSLAGATRAWTVTATSSPPPARSPTRPALSPAAPRRPGGGRCGRGLRHSGIPGCCSARRGVEGGPAEVGPAEGGNAGDAITKPAGCEPSAALRPGLPGRTAWPAGTAGSTVFLDTPGTPSVCARSVHLLQVQRWPRAGALSGSPKVPFSP